VDAFGRTINVQQIIVVITLPDCMSCTTKAIHVNELARTVGKRGVFIIPNRVEELTSSQKKDFEHARLLTEPVAKSVPEEMAMFAPQVGELSDGRISRVPDAAESMDAFVKGCLE